MLAAYQKLILEEKSRSFGPTYWQSIASVKFNPFHQWMIHVTQKRTWFGFLLIEKDSFRRSFNSTTLDMNCFIVALMSEKKRWSDGSLNRMIYREVLHFSEIKLMHWTNSSESWCTRRRNRSRPGNWDSISFPSATKSLPKQRCMNVDSGRKCFIGLGFKRLRVLEWRITQILLCTHHTQTS